MEEARWRGSDAEDRGEGGGQRKMIGMAVCAVGAEGEDDVGRERAEAVGEEVLEVIGGDGVERAVGEVEKGRGTGADRCAGEFELGGAPCPQGNGERFAGSGGMVVATFTACGAEDVDGRAGVSGEGEEAGKGVTLIVRMGDNGEQA